MNKKISLVLTLDASAAKKKAAVLKQIKDQGFEVNSILDGPGIIIGRIAEAKLGALAQIAGLSVERDQEVKLAPPDAEVQ